MRGVLEDRSDNFSLFYAGMADRRPRGWAWLRSWLAPKPVIRAQPKPAPAPAPKKPTDTFRPAA